MSERIARPASTSGEEGPSRSLSVISSAAVETTLVRRESAFRHVLLADVWPVCDGWFVALYSLRPATGEDSDVLFRLHRASLGPYIEEVYGPWDDEVQKLHHDRWLGTAVLTTLLIGADERGLPVQLEAFDINPARRLYERLGSAKSGARGAR